MNDHVPDHQSSLWLSSQAATKYPRLDTDIEADVAIVGGGIAGVTIAYTLQDAGYSVALLEKHSLGSGTTGGTTGKVTTQHGLFYKNLLSSVGEKSAKLYADLYLSAMDDIKQLIVNEKIDCGWEEQDNYVYTTKQKKVKGFKREVRAAQQLGLPASFTADIGLPFDVKAAVKFSSQAKMDAVAYTRQLAGKVAARGGLVFEQTNVQSIDENDHVVVRGAGGSVRARCLVLATKIPPYPLIGRLTYAAIVYPQTSYLVAAPTSVKLPGMYISPDSGYYSLMNATVESENYLLIGGENHIPGLGSANKRYKILADYAAKTFDMPVITHKWKAMDYIAYDSLPVVGPLYPRSKRIFAVTGFKKWGLSTSMVAAGVIRSLVQGEQTDATQLFYPHRLRAYASAPKTLISYVKESVFPE